MNRKLKKKINELQQITKLIKEAKQRLDIRMSKYNTQRIDPRVFFSYIKEEYDDLKKKIGVLIYIVIAVTSIYVILGMILASKGMIMPGLFVCFFGAFMLMLFYFYIKSYLKHLEKKKNIIREKLGTKMESSLEEDK